MEQIGQVRDAAQERVEEVLVSDQQNNQMANVDYMAGPAQDQKRKLAVYEYQRPICAMANSQKTNSS